MASTEDKIVKKTNCLVKHQYSIFRSVSKNYYSFRESVKMNYNFKTNKIWQRNEKLLP